MTVRVYAELRGVSPQSVTEALRFKEQGKTYHLPGVVQVEKFSKYYLLTVDTEAAKQPKKPRAAQ